MLKDGRERLGVATDLGRGTAAVRNKLAGCDALVLEANYDVKRLMRSDRPQSIICRIRGGHGHLSNAQAAHLCAACAGPRLKTIVPAHQDSFCNTPELARKSVEAALAKCDRADQVAMTVAGGKTADKRT